MESDFLCPKCRSYLNIGNKIVFSIKVNANQAGLLLLEKDLGNYEVKKQEQIQYEYGDILGFFCPICHENLVSDVHSNLAKVLMLDADHQEYEIFFSRISGEHATFKVKETALEVFGSNYEKYINLFKIK